MKEKRILLYEKKEKKKGYNIMEVQHPVLSLEQKTKFQNRYPILSSQIVFQNLSHNETVGESVV